MTKRCPLCGTENHDDFSFCTSCGANIENTKVTSQNQTNQSGNSGSGHTCTWCGVDAGYTREEGRMDSKWGMTSHKFTIFICNNCSYTHLFGKGRSIFDFD